MVDKQPSFVVRFLELAVAAIKRLLRGHVVFVMDDNTSDVDEITYAGLADVKKTDYSKKNYLLLTLCFMGNPKKVTVIKRSSVLSETTEKLNKYDNYILIDPAAESTDVIAYKNYLNAQRQKNNYSIAILGNATAPDALYIANFVSEDITITMGGENVELTAKEYTARIAGALAGLPSSRSLTYYELPELVNAPLVEDTDEAVASGQLVILHQNGTYKLGRGANSLTTLGDGITEAFQKIRVVGIMDMIANDIISTFRTLYVGKYTNNYANKKRLVGAINAYLNVLATEGLLDEANQNEVMLSYNKIKAYLEGKGVDTSELSYVEIISYNTGSKVLLDGVCSPTDTMEDLDLGFYLFQALESEV